MTLALTWWQTADPEVFETTWSLLLILMAAILLNTWSSDDYYLLLSTFPHFAATPPCEAERPLVI